MAGIYSDSSSTREIVLNLCVGRVVHCRASAYCSLYTAHDVSLSASCETSRSRATRRRRQTVKIKISLHRQQSVAIADAHSTTVYIHRVFHKKRDTVLMVISVKSQTIFEFLSLTDSPVTLQ